MCYYIFGDFMFNLLKICNDDFIYFFINNDFFDVICYIGIVLCLFLCILLQFQDYFEKAKLYKQTKKILSFVSFIFVIFVVLSFIFIIDKNKYRTCANKVNNFLVNDKVIFTGDSRMEFIEDDDDTVKPFNVSFVAKSGAEYGYFSEKLVPELEDVLDNRNKKFNYYVTFNMGVNDLNDRINIKKRADEYFDLYSDVARKYKNVNFYIVSVNPIFWDKLQNYQRGSIRTNKRIEEFNDRIVYKLDKSNLKNMHYCDTYDGMKFGSDDGLHYDRETNIKFMNYVINKCMKLNIN